MKKHLYELTNKEFIAFCDTAEGIKIAQEIDLLCNDETPLVAYKGICRLKEIFEIEIEVSNND